MDFPPWNSLSLYHWSSILSMYNVSIAGGRVTILPTIKLSHAVSPQLAKQISNPNDVQHFQWQSLATAALDPLDFSGWDFAVTSYKSYRVFYLIMLPFIFRYGGTVEIRRTRIQYGRAFCTIESNGDISGRSAVSY